MAKQPGIPKVKNYMSTPPYTIGDEQTMARAGEGLQIIKTDPLPPALDPDMPQDWDGKKWYSTAENGWANY